MFFCVGIPGCATVGGNGGSSGAEACAFGCSSGLSVSLVGAGEERPTMSKRILLDVAGTFLLSRKNEICGNLICTHKSEFVVDFTFVQVVEIVNAEFRKDYDVCWHVTFWGLQL